MKQAKLLLLLSIMAIFIAMPAFSEESESGLEVDLGVGFYTDYIFRSFNLYDGASIQPTVALSYDTGSFGSLIASGWAHLSAEGGESTAEKFTEIDYTLGYEIGFGPVTFGAGHIWYTYPKDSDEITNTDEFYATMAIDTWGSPTVKAYHDYDQFDNQYYELWFSHTLETDAVGEGFNITPYVTLAFASNAEKVYQDDGLVHVTFGTSFEAKLGDVSVIPSLNVTRESDDAGSNEFWAGTNFSYSF